MKLPLSWLKEYLPKLPTPQTLADVLMMHGLEVEEIIDHSGDFKNVVVGEIVGIKAHPNANKLRLTEVVVTTGGQPQEIVCGAPNIEVGQKVPVALLGAKLPNGMTIEPRAIRGITSHGMLCAEDELGLGKNHAGIMVLAAGLKIGTPFVVAAGMDDVVFDIAIPANRSDLFSVRGLAREIAAILGQAAKFPSKKLTESTALAKKSISVHVADTKQCPIYNARVIRGVKVQSSPLWLQNHLRSAGMRPINAVVDATNYIMLDYGQPLHAFDAAIVAGGAITVRSAKNGEHLTTLDKQNRKLDSSMMVIADDKGPIALAGVMGGAHTEISGFTSDIILESAIFDPVSIRKTSWKLGLQSEASRRFEKGLPRTLPEEASAAAAALIVELCGGTVERGSVVVGTTKTEAATITIKPTFISESLGMSVPSTKAKTVLTRLGFKVTGSTSWKLTVPPWRLDVNTPEDIVDEVGRMTGYDALSDKLPPGKPEQKDVPPIIRFKDEVRNILVDLGFSEVISHAFYGAKEAAGDQGDHFVIANPLDKTQHVLRKSIRTQIEDVLSRQADAGQDAMVFEIGRVFNPNLKGDILRQQPWKVAFGMTHKGAKYELEPISAELQKRLQAPVQINIVVSDRLVRGRTLEYCEIDLAELMIKSKFILGPWDPNRHSATNVRYREQSRYPSVTRDVSFWGPDGVDWVESLFPVGRPLLIKIETVGEFMKDGKKSFTFHLIFQSPDRTLTKAEVDAIMDRLFKTLTSLGATIR